MDDAIEEFLASRVYQYNLVIIPLRQGYATSSCVNTAKCAARMNNNRDSMYFIVVVNFNYCYLQ